MSNMQNIQTDKPRPAILDAVTEWEAQEPQDIPINDIKTVPELQPRNPALIKGAIGRLEQETRLQDMTGSLKTPLKALPSFDARDAVLVVETGKGLLLVDGHHRLKAYKSARRTTIPAKVLKKSMTLAIAVSGMANTRGSTVALHKDEVTEAVWQTVSALLSYGRSTWERAQTQGYSYRVVEKMFNYQISHDTVKRMVKAVLWLKEESVTQDNWPDWRAYCKLRREGIAELPEIDDSEEAERLARKILLLTNSKSNQVVQLAWMRHLEMRSEVEKLREQQLGPREEDGMY